MQNAVLAVLLGCKADNKVGMTSRAGRLAGESEAREQETDGETLRSHQLQPSTRSIRSFYMPAGGKQAQASLQEQVGCGKSGEAVGDGDCRVLALCHNVYAIHFSTRLI